jgi:hypothetical protein
MLLLVGLSTAIVVKSWYEMKRSPYFFMRRQAEKRLQNYALTSFGLIAATAFAAFFMLQAPAPQSSRAAVLSDAKPATAEVQALVEEVTALDAEFVAESSELPRFISTTDENPLDVADVNSLLTSVNVLPARYDRFEPTAELTDETDLGAILFSTKINDDYKAVDPANLFAVGEYTLFATFDYDGMADGMEWAWVWRHEGEVVDGGNELWAYGDEGPGYIYYGPEEGFRPGEYSLEVWVNGELFTRSEMTMTGTALSAGN